MMRRLAIVLRKGVAATTAAIVIAVAVLVPLLDAGPALAIPHIEQPDAGGCVQYEHDHLACHIFHVSPLDFPTVHRSTSSDTVAAPPLMWALVLRVARISTSTTRSRAPPHA